MIWVNRLLRRKKLEKQLDREIAFHLEQHTAELVALGYDLAEARRLARLDLGGPEQVKEECRDARGTRWLNDLVQDVRFAIRTLRQRPGFSAVVLLSLALGTSATTVMFSLVDGVMLKPLAYPDPGTLLSLQEKTDYRTPQGDLWAFTYPNYLDCKRAVPSADMGAWSFYGGTLSKPGAPEYLNGARVSADLIPILGAAAAFGRGFLPEEDRRGAEPVIIISHRLWQRHFGGSRNVLGSKLVYNSKSYTIIGVMPSTFRIVDREFDVFVPIGQDSSLGLQNRRRHGYGVFARLHSGATLAQIQSELAAVGSRLAAQYPDTNKGRTFIAGPLKLDIGDTESTLWLLLGAVTLVLLIACANIASLLLARAVARERELAMRAALGAGRGRLIRQCLTESAVLALAGGALGVALAAIGIHPFTLFWPGGLPRIQDVQLNGQVLLFALGVSLFSGLLFGLAPALRTPTHHLEFTLRATSRSRTGGARRLHGVFVVSEIAIAVVLLVSAGLLGRTMLRLAALDPGVNLHNVLTSRIALSPATLANPDATRAAWQYLIDQVRAVPGVQAVATVDTVPMRQGSNAISYSVTPANLDTYTRDLPVVLANSVSADYLRVTGIPLRRGRFLADADRKGTQPVAVIDDVLAQQSFHGQDPIGKPIWIGLGTDPLIIVGVVGHVRQWGLAADDQSNVRAQLYYPFAQVPDRLVRRWSELMSVAVKTNVDPATILEPLHRGVRGVTGDQVIYDIHTFEDLAAASLARHRFLLLLFGVFAALALLLACIGIYGVLAYLSGQRVPEIGVRMALGATSSRILWMMLRQSLMMIFAGIAVGSGGGWLGTRYLTKSVQGARTIEPIIFGLMLALLVTAALIASFIPARRASLVDPITALRQE